MKREITAILLSSMFAVSACSAIGIPSRTTQHAPSKSSHGAAHWSYQDEDGPAHWATLSADYHMCAAGAMQSPIDLAGVNASGDVSLKLDYTPGDVSIVYNGHTVQANFEPGRAAAIDHRNFELLQLHFHTPSEHVKSAKPFPIEVHFVHATGAGELLVLGVLFVEGEANAELTTILDALGTRHGPVKTTLDPNGLLPHDLSVFRYMGSLTTPPCSEGVNWHVAKSHISASAEQIVQLHQVLGENARPVQPHNNRLLLAPVD